MYTAIPAPALEKHLDSSLKRVVQEICQAIPTSSLRYVLLAGGYGRHEGGVLLEGDELRLHNNLDIVVVVNTWLDKQRYLSKLSTIQRYATQLCGVDVDLSMCSKGQVSRNLHQIFWFDTLQSHCCLYGSVEELEQMKKNLKQPTLHNGFSLIANRATLLLLNRFLGQHTHEFSASECRLLQKHLVKATIGLGDVYLLLSEQYTPSYRKRLSLLQNFPSIVPCEDVRQKVIEAIQLRFEPRYTKQAKSSELLFQSEWILERYKDAIALYEAYRRKTPFDPERPIDGYLSTLSLPRRSVFRLRHWRKSPHHPLDQMIQSFLAILFQTHQAISLEEYLDDWGANVDSNFSAFLRRHQLTLNSKRRTA